MSEWTLIESDGALAEVLEALGSAPEVAVDTEFMRRDTYHPQIALLQLCAGDHAWLIDPLAIDDLAALRAFMTDPKVIKVLHSCSEDLEVFRHWLGVLPEPLIDTQRAAALLGEPFGVGYRGLVEALLGVELEKGETRSNWLQRPLTQSQCHYAAQDVLELVPAWNVLARRAREQDRFPWLLEEGAEARAALSERESDLHRRVKGWGKLNGRQLEVLRRLCLWREARARRLDRPRGWVVDDKACLALAREMPRHRESLASLGVLPPAVLRRLGDELLTIVAEACATPDGDLPETAPRPLDPDQRARFKALRDSLRRRCDELGIAPEAALSGAELELLLREAAGETIRVPERWSGWRGATVVDPMRAMLRREAGASHG
jgi:ribonuclease D